MLNSSTLMRIGSTLGKTDSASSNTTTSSQVGLNAGVLAGVAGKLMLIGYTVSTNTSGTNGLFDNGINSVVTLNGAAVSVPPAPRTGWT